MATVLTTLPGNLEVQPLKIHVIRNNLFQYLESAIYCNPCQAYVCMSNLDDFVQVLKFIIWMFAV